jgi:hypothetical protein
LTIVPDKHRSAEAKTAEATFYEHWLLGVRWAMDVRFGPLQSVAEVMSHHWTAYLAPRARHDRAQ